MENKAQFLPFHGINGFMRPDYQVDVVKNVLSNISRLSDDTRGRLNSLVRKTVVIPGFRNCLLAPPALKIKPYINSMEKNAGLTAFTLKAWCELHESLAIQIINLLKDRGWELLPAEVDRTKLPGFIPIWPSNEDFEVINQAYKEAYPQEEIKSDDVSLMAAWISVSLPFSDDDDEV